MKRVLILGIVAIFLGAALVGGVLSMEEKEISSSNFSVGTRDNYVNVTDPELEITDQAGDIFNNEANLLIHNNATYDDIKFKITAGELNGYYPSNVALDLDDNGRDEYRFGGWSTGQWGNQSNIINQYWQNGNTHDYFPTPDGQMAYVKLPSRATVSNVEFNVNHPLIPVLQEARIEDSDDGYVGNSYFYLYGYSSTYYSYSYAYSYYYPTSYWDNYRYGSEFRYSYPSYERSSGSYTYKGGQPDSRIYFKWDLDDQEFSVPEGATILKYELNAPIGNYHGYAGSYGYDWTSNTARYYAGEKTFGVYAVTDDVISESDCNRYSSYYGYNYYYDYRYGGDMDDYEDMYLDFIPTNRTTPADSYTTEESFSNNYIDYIMDVNYNLTGIVNDWNDGTLDNNGIMLTMYKTPYGYQPFTGYDYYNSAGSYSGARSQKNYQFYYGGYIYNPYHTYYSQYRAYRPRFIISYDLASTNLNVDVGNDGDNEYEHSGQLVGSVNLGNTPGYAQEVNDYLRGHLPDEVDDYGNEFTYVPIKLSADSAGKVVLDNLNIKYDYTANVIYNPETGTLLNELNSVVPPEEEGWSMIPINVTSNTEGKIMFGDLELSGEMPNYRPMVSEVEVEPVPEGIVDDEWLDLTQFFYDIDQDVSTLEYRIQQNSQSSHVDLFINKPETRGGPVYLGIDTTKDENWYGDVEVVISATDDLGKDIWTDPFTITIEPVNDEPFMEMELPEISGEEGIDPILIEYRAPTGRDVAMGKISFIMSEDGEPYFDDIEGERIHLGFQLLDSDMEETMLEAENEDGFKIYRGTDGEISLYVLPPEYTEDPYNFIIVIGSNPDYNHMKGMYYLRVFTSDDLNDIYGQTYQTVPIMIEPVNDPPMISSIPDVIMDEDGSYEGSIDFVEEYLSDIDSDLEDLSVSFVSSAPEVEVYLNDDGHLMVDAEKDFNGVIPITVEATDGGSEVYSTFSVRIRSINDIPKVVVTNLFNEKIIDDMFYIRGTANDVEKDLRWIEVGVVEENEFLYEDDWDIADGVYVWQYLLDIRDLEDGKYDVFIRAYDGRDYSEELSFVVNVVTPKPQPPSPPPVVTITTSILGDQSDKIEIEGTAVDETGYVEFVEYRVDGGIWKKAALEGENWKAIVNTRVYTNENHNFSVRAFDGKSYSDVTFVGFDVFNEDSDLDGIPNAMEKILLLDPFNPIDGTMDFDEDGFSNAEEVEAGTDVFSGKSHPDTGEEEKLLDTWAIIFIAVAIISAIVIIALFILNIRIEKNMQRWREDLHSKRAERRPKTLLQKIVDLTPIYSAQAAGPALASGAPPEGEEAAALPPAKEQPPQ